MSDDWLDDVSIPAASAAPAQSAASGGAGWLDDVSTPADASQSAPSAGDGDQNDRRMARGTPAAGEGQPGVRERLGQAVDDLKSLPERNQQVKEGVEAFGDLNLDKNFFVNAYHYSQALQGIAADQEGKYNQQRAAGLTTLPFEDWLDQPGNNPINIYQQQHGDKPDTSIDWAKLPATVVKNAMDHPGAFIGSILGGLKDDPELLVMPELGLADKLATAGKVAETAGRAVEGGAVMGAQSAAISTASQLKDTGSVDPNKVGQEGATGFVMGTALMGAHATMDATWSTAKGLGERIIGDGKPLPPAERAKIDSSINDGITGGQSPTEAYVRTMKAHGMDPDKADEIGDALDTAQQDLKEHVDAAQQQGAKNPDGNAEALRPGQGDAGVLRQPGDGADQGGGGSIAAKNHTPSTDPGPPNQEQLDQTEVGGSPIPKIEGAPSINDISQPLEFTSSAKPYRLETPKADGSVDPRLHPDEYFHTTDTPEISELDPAFSKPGNKYGQGVYLSKDYALSRAHKPTSIVNGELRPSDAGAGETLIATFEPKNAFDVDRMYTPSERAVILMKDGAEAGKPIVDSIGGKPVKPTSGETLWKHLVNNFDGNKEAAQAKLRSLGYDAIKFDGGKNIVSFGKVSARPHDLDFMPVKARMPDTKVVDANGEPKVLYHGTDGAFVKHRPGSVYATDSPETAHTYAVAGGTNTHPNIRPVYMDLKNPLIVDAGGKNFWGKGDDMFSPGIAIEKARAEGNDGVIVHNLKDSADSGKDVAPATVYIALSPKQVFTAMGKQAGFADPKMLAAIGLAGLGGAGVYALTGDKSKAIAAAAAAGLLPFAKSMVSRIRIGNLRIADAMKDQRFDTKTIFRNNAFQRVVSIYAANQWQRATQALLKGEPDIKASNIRIRDYVQGHRDVTLSPRELAAADEVRKFLDTMGQRGLDAKVLRSTIEDYLPGLYQMKPFKSVTDLIDTLTQQDAFRGNYTGMSPKSKHAMQKVIPDYRTVDALVKAGKLDIIPLTNNPMEIAALYAKSLSKTIANKTLIDTLKKAPGPDFKMNADGDKVPLPLVMPITPADAAAKMIQTMAIVGKKFDLPEETIAMMNKFAVLSAPKDYVPISHPALEGLRVHQDVAGPLKLLFDTNDPGVITKAMLATSMVAKTALFSFSLFHAGSLILNAGALTGASPVRMWRGLAGARAALIDTAFRPEVADALQAGLTLAHRMDDVDPTIFQRALNLADNYVSSLPGGRVAVLPVKGVAYAQKAINHFMWDVLHPTLKLGTFMAERARWQEMNAAGKAKGGAYPDAMRQIATGVNDIYGGLNWFELANNVDTGIARTVATALFSPQGRRWQQVLMLAPDWNIAALRTWFHGALAAAPGIEPRASDHLYKTYLMSSALMYLGAAEGLQRHYTGENIWDKDDWSYVDMGDGRKIQLNKHFMEGVHLIASPAKFLINKAGFIPKEAMSQLFGREYVTYNNTTGSIGPPMADTSALGRAAHAAKGLISPITASNLGDPASAVAGFFGIPIYGKTYEQQAQAAGDKATAAGKPRGKAEAQVKARQRRDDAKRRANAAQ